MKKIILFSVALSCASAMMQEFDDEISTVRYTDLGGKTASMKCAKGSKSYGVHSFGRDVWMEETAICKDANGKSATRFFFSTSYEANEAGEVIKQHSPEQNTMAKCKIKGDDLKCENAVNIKKFETE